MKPIKNKHVDTENRIVTIREKEVGEWVEGEMGKGDQLHGDGNYIFSDEHSAVYTEVGI